jgi:hypothetical protein
MVRSGSDRLDGVKFIRPSDRVGYRRVARDPFVHWQFDICSCRIGRLRSIGVLDDPSYVACSSGWPRGFGDAETAERDRAIMVILGLPSIAVLRSLLAHEPVICNTSLLAGGPPVGAVESYGIRAGARGGR